MRDLLRKSLFIAFGQRRNDRRCNRIAVHRRYGSRNMIDQFIILRHRQNRSNFFGKHIVIERFVSGHSMLSRRLCRIRVDSHRFQQFFAQIIDPRIQFFLCFPKHISEYLHFGFSAAAHLLGNRVA